MENNFMDLDSDPFEAHHITQLRSLQENSFESQDLNHMLAENPTAQQKSPRTLKEVITCSLKKRKSKSKNKMIRRLTKTKTQKESAYKKNICGYITKKVIREFIYGNYKKNVKDLCEIENVGIKEAQDFYESKIQAVTGPSHLSSLFSTQKASQIPILRVFIRFFQWFIKQRYVRHLFLEGKMQIKKAYIEYKNTKLLQIVKEYEKALFNECESFTSLSGSDYQESAELNLIK